jgi:shikimate dehydrogenase
MRKFGLIGYPLSHSFSKNFFTEKFNKEAIRDTEYLNFSIASINQLQDILIAETGLEGLNVTSPYTEQVLPFLDFKDDTVESIGACNCIKIVGGKLYGFNTDTTGFERSLEDKLQPYHTHALILGTGGAAKAVEYVLQKRNIQSKFVSRQPGESEKIISYGQVDAALLETYLLIINTSPIGMFPNVDEYPQLPYRSLTAKHYLFDLVYNPAMTKFLQKGDERGAAIQNGLPMLIIQAEESWRIWNQFSPHRDTKVHED